MSLDYIEDFIFCSLGGKCLDDSLKSHLTPIIPPEKEKKTFVDSCEDNEIKCIIFNTDIDDYTFEAYVYTHANKSHFIRILTNINSKSIFLNHLNKIELDSK